MLKISQSKDLGIDMDTDILECVDVIACEDGQVFTRSLVQLMLIDKSIIHPSMSKKL